MTELGTQLHKQHAFKLTPICLDKLKVVLISRKHRWQFAKMDTSKENTCLQACNLILKKAIKSQLAFKESDLIAS